MAVITATVTAIRAITTVAKVLAKKSAKGGAKKFITNKAKDKAKGKIKDKFFGKKEKKEKGGALALRPSSAITTVGSTPLIPSANISKSLDSKLDKSSTDVKPTPKIAYDKLTQTIDNIVKITGDIRDASRRQLESDKDILEEERKRRKEAARKKREALLESGKKVVGGVAAGAAAVGGKFGIGDFFTNILIGGAIVAIINAFKEIEKLFNDFKENAHLIFVTLKYGLGAFAQVAKALGAIVKSVGGKILGGFTGLVGKIGKAITTGLKTGLTKLGNVIFNFGKNAFNTIKNIANAIVNGISKGAQAAAKFLAARTPQAIKNFFKGAKSFVDDAAKFAATGIQKGKELAQSGVTKIKGIIGKLPISNILKEKIGAAQKTGIFSALKKIKVPIIGPLIVLVAGLLSGEPAGQATSKALGTMIGGLAGSPLGPIGMLVGELLGAEVGDLFYTAFLKGGDEGGLEAAKEQLKQKWESLLSGGKAALDWGAKGFTRLYDSLPKIKLPVPIFGVREIPDPKSLLDPMGIARNIGAAFLSDDPMTPGKLIEPKDGDNVTNVSEVKRDTKNAKFGDFILASDGSVGVFDGMGTRRITDEERALYDSGATNIDGSKPRAQSQPQEKMMGGSASGFEANLAALLKSYEGLRTNAYKDSKGIPTIGMGATYYPSGFRLSGKVKMGDTITEQEALWIKQQHIKEHRQRVLREIPSSEYFKIPENVRAALESKAFNYGSLGRTLTEIVMNSIKTGDYQPVADYFRNNLAKHDNGLNSWRRNDEAGIIETGTSSRANVSFSKTGKGTGQDVSQSSPPATLDPVESEQDNSTMMRQATPDNDDKAAQNVEPESAPTQTSPATLADSSPPSSTSTASSIQRKASYEQGAEQTIAIPLAAQRSQQSPMMRSKSRVMMMGGDSLDRYYKAQLLGALYKRG